MVGDAQRPQPLEQSQSLVANISNGIVGLVKECYGKGPQQAKTYVDDDLVVVVLRGGFTAVEQTLLDSGHTEAVLRQRQLFATVMRERFTAIVEAETGRRVSAHMSTGHQEPDLLAELFVLAPAPSVKA